MGKGQLWRQYVIAGVANIGIACTGFFMGWTSPVNLILNDPSLSPLGHGVTVKELSWIGSLLMIGALMGPFFGGFAASKIGRKWGMLSSALPLVFGWLLIALATNIRMIYFGRVFWGLAVGMLFTISPMYCAEIAMDEVRGALGSILQVSCTCGYLLVYVVGPFTTYNVISYAGIAVAASFIVLFYFMPESPIYYLTKDDVSSAAESLMVIRGDTRAGVQAELDKMASQVKASMERTATLTDMFRGNNFKALYISCALVSFQQLCGVCAILFYLTAIFNAAGADLDGSISTIIIGAVQVLASLSTPVLVEKLGRRILLLTSSFGTAVSLGLLAMYFILADYKNPVTESIGFIPILALIIFIVSYCLGLGPLPWAMMSELFPVEVKEIASTIATAYCWGISFLVTRFFNPIADSIGMGPSLLIFGVFCVISFFFTMFFVPETKGKSYQEIQEMLAGNPSKLEKA